MEKYDVIVVGAGAAGLSAAIYATRKKLKTAVVAPEVGGQTALALDIENYLGFSGGPGIELTEKFKEHVKKFKDLELKIGERVTKIEKSKEGFRVYADTGKVVYESKALIITSGRVPRRLGIPGEEKFNNKGVSYCSTCDGPLFGGKEVVVIGGGNAALDTAIFMTKIAKHVNIININPRFSGDPVTIEKVEKGKKITIYQSAETKEILGDKFVGAIKFLDKTSGEEKEIKVQGVFVEIGSLPSSEFFRGLIKTNQWGEIEINERNHTSKEGIFAAGDVTSVPFKQTIIAAGEGAKAALSAYEYIAKKSAAGTTH